MAGEPVFQVKPKPTTSVQSDNPGKGLPGSEGATGAASTAQFKEYDPDSNSLAIILFQTAGRIRWITDIFKMIVPKSDRSQSKVVDFVNLVINKPQIPAQDVVNNVALAVKKGLLELEPYLLDCYKKCMQLEEFNNSANQLLTISEIELKAAVKDFDDTLLDNYHVLVSQGPETSLETSLGIKEISSIREQSSLDMLLGELSINISHKTAPD